MSKFQIGNNCSGSNEIRLSEIIEKQNQQYEQLKEEFLRQRAQYQECYKNYQREEADLQRDLEMLRAERKNLEESLKQIIQAKESEEQESNARELIENIWDILQNYRRNLFEELENDNQNEINQNLSDIPFKNQLNNQLNNHLNNSQKSPLKKSMKNTLKSPFTSNSHQKYEEIKSDFQREFNQQQMFESENDMESSFLIDNLEQSIPKLQLSLSKPFTPVPEIPIQMQLPMRDSIASRRTPRGPTIFYGEPDLRRKYDPNGPYAFGSSTKSPSHSRRRSHN